MQLLLRSFLLAMATRQSAQSLPASELAQPRWAGAASTSWRQLAPPPWSARSGRAMATAANGTLFLVGGAGAGPRAALADVWAASGAALAAGGGAGAWALLAANASFGARLDAGLASAAGGAPLLLLAGGRRALAPPLQQQLLAQGRHAERRGY